MARGVTSRALMHGMVLPLGRHDELVNITLANMGMEAIFQEQGLELSEAEIKAEMSDAADEFMAAGEEFDDGRLREQVMEVLKVGQRRKKLCVMCSS
jgi:FKBP-type peptidyl-prolyl cis-trans isomerase (trigger factor)